MALDDTMNPDTLDTIIKTFWKSERYNPDYYNGYCSEFAVALDRFLNHRGTIGKAGLFHTIYIYKGYFWDIHGKMTRNQLSLKMPITGTSIVQPANQKELDHIYSLLNTQVVNHILRGLKKSQKVVTKSYHK